MNNEFKPAYDYKLYPNQTLYANTVHQDHCDHFVMWDYDDLMKAGGELSNSAFKLWIFATFNKSYCTIPLSANVFEYKYGLSRNAFNKAMKELKSKDYVKIIKINGVDCHVFKMPDDI